LVFGGIGSSGGVWHIDGNEKDYRNMFDTEGKNIDAVMIATPRPYAHTGGAAGDAAWEACCPPHVGRNTNCRPQMLQRGVNHQQDWIRACKGGARGVSNFAVATRYIEWLSLGAIALRAPGKLMWDANKGRFTNNDESNKLLNPSLRKGWDLKA
jgi:hypothetical protein